MTKRDEIIIEYETKRELREFERGFQIEQQVRKLDRSLEDKPTDYREGEIRFRARQGDGDTVAYHVHANGAFVERPRAYRVTRRQRRIIASVRLDGKRIPYTVLAEEKKPRRVRKKG